LYIARLITYVINSVDKWITDTIAHSQPVAAEPNYINISVPVKESRVCHKCRQISFHAAILVNRENVLEQVVGLQWQPAKGEKGHYHHQHFYNLQRNVALSARSVIDVDLCREARKKIRKMKAATDKHFLRAKEFEVLGHLFLVAEQRGVSFILGVPWGLRAPQPVCQQRVHSAND